MNDTYLTQSLPNNSTFPFKIPFPPPIEESELKPNLKKGKLPVRATNQFLLYRTAVIKTLRENGVQDINMRTISKMASQLWNLEPAFVQQEYKSLALKAKGLHQKTAKVMTSFEEAISQRPLAPMPESSSSSNSDVVDDTSSNDTNEVLDNAQFESQYVSDTYNIDTQYTFYQEPSIPPPMVYTIPPQQGYYIQANDLPFIYSEDYVSEYHFGYSQ